MATFVLIPGAGGVAWYWHRVVPLLEHAGHEAIPVDLPGDDDRAGLEEYAGLVLGAIEMRDNDLVLVAQSLGGFTAPVVCQWVRVNRLVLVNAMIPLPGEAAGAWWGNTDSSAARQDAARRGGYSTEFDEATYFLHDLAPDLIREGETHVRPQSERIFGDRCEFDAWPDIPIHVIAGRGDRFFPIEFQRRVARERLGLPVDELPGGHLLALSNPRGLTDRLLTTTA